MAGFNPFAPQQGGQSKAPQMQGVQAPNVPMQSQPSLMTTLGPTVASKAMGSDAAASAGNFVKDGVKDAWSALTSPSNAPVSELSNALASTPTAQTVGELSANGLMGSAAASAAPAAAAEGLFANGLMGAAAAPVATTAATAGAGLAPAALLAGPFAPLVIGGAMLAANSGK